MKQRFRLVLVASAVCAVELAVFLATRPAKPQWTFTSTFSTSSPIMTPDDGQIVKPCLFNPGNGTIAFCTQQMVTQYPYRCQVIKRWVLEVEQLEL